MSWHPRRVSLCVGLAQYWNPGLRYHAGQGPLGAGCSFVGGVGIGPVDAWRI